MKLLSLKQTEAFLAESRRVSEAASQNREFYEDGFFDTSFLIPRESGKIMYMFRKLFTLPRSSKWSLIFVEASGIFEGLEDKNLYGMMREARGLPTNISYGDGHLFDKEEVDDMVTFAYVFTLFGYDFRIIDEKREINAFFSHEDHFFINSLFFDKEISSIIREITPEIDVL